MSQPHLGRNDPCPCGSGKRYKHCCGRLLSGAPSAHAEQAAASSDPLHERIFRDISLGNLARAEVHCRAALDTHPQAAFPLNALGLIAWRVGKHAIAREYFARACAADPSWPVPRENLQALAEAAASTEPHPDSVDAGSGERFLLIKAWGYGFWADVDHVLGALLLAELTRRTPVIHWGGNSLFSDNAAADAFRTFFECVSSRTIDDLSAMRCDHFPPKWSATNLRSDDVAKWEGPHSRMGAVYFLNRKEAIAVSDFHIPVISLIPWIEPAHPLHGLSSEDLYRYLIERYLRPQPFVQEQIDAFFARHLAGGPFVAAHVRGADKYLEQRDLDDINSQYFGHIDMAIADSDRRLFLLTDSQPVVDAFRRRYGERLVLTDSARSGDTTGVHYLKGLTGRAQLGRDVMMDAYLAARAECFIGNGGSNVSCMIGYLKNWDAGKCTLLSTHLHRLRNTFIYG